MRESDLADEIAWPEALSRVAAQPYPAKTLLFREAEPVAAVFAIASGVVKLVARAGDRDAIVDLRYPGWIVGAAAATMTSPHPVSAEAVAASVLRRIDATDFTTLFERDAAVGAWVRRMHAREVCEQTRRNVLLRRDPSERVLGLLRDLLKVAPVVARPGGWAFQPLLTREEMGQMVALSTEHVSRVLAHLESRATLVRDRGWIVVPTGSVLASVARARVSRVAGARQVPKDTRR